MKAAFILFSFFILCSMALKAQWAWDLKDKYTLLFPADSIREHKIKSCMVKHAVVSPWFNRYWYFPMMDIDMEVEFDVNGRITLCKYWPGWRYVYSYNESGELMNRTNWFLNSINDQTMYRYTDRLCTQEIYTGKDSTNNHTIHHSYHLGMVIRDSISYTCQGCGYHSWYDSRYSFDQGRCKHQYSNPETDRRICTDIVDVGNGQLLSRETTYHVVYYSYDNLGRLTSMKNTYEWRFNDSGYGCGTGVKISNSKTPGTTINYLFQWEHGILTGLDVTHRQSIKAHYNFEYQYY